jgi:glycosyltransferase involved in cell wall biosynthesis
MAMGKAVVGSHNSGMGDRLAGDAGLLYSPPDADELANHIVRLLRDPGLRSDFGQRARSRATEVFGRAATLAAAATFYERALEEVQSTPRALAVPPVGHLARS